VWVKLCINGSCWKHVYIYTHMCLSYLYSHLNLYTCVWSYVYVYNYIIILHIHASCNVHDRFQHRCKPFLHMILIMPMFAG
jgi:hypothetical protein